MQVDIDVKVESLFLEKKRTREVVSSILFIHCQYFTQKIQRHHLKHMQKSVRAIYEL